MEFERFNSNIQTLFKLEKCVLNEPIQVLYGDKFLSCHWSKNLVDFYTDGNTDKQLWIIEKDNDFPGVFFIKTAFKRNNNICYLGSPNMDGIVRLYTSRTRYTMWKIKPKTGLQYDNCNYIISYAGEKFNKSEVSLVIARYNEDIDWVSAYNDIAVVYNKGENNISGIKNIINVENIGREGHTYLYHIINNYENLSDRVIFSQGDPFLHNETILYGIDNYKLFLDLQPLGVRWLREQNIPPIEIEEKNKIVTDYGLNYMTIQLDNNLISPEFYDRGMSELNKNYRRDYKTFDNNNELIIDSIARDFLSRAKFPILYELESLSFTYSALFSVIRPKIIMNDIDSYKRLLNELIMVEPSGGANGYVLEKLWLVIFGY